MNRLQGRRVGVSTVAAVTTLLLMLLLPPMASVVAQSSSGTEAAAQRTAAAASTGRPGGSTGGKGSLAKTGVNTVALVVLGLFLIRAGILVRRLSEP